MQYFFLFAENIYRKLGLMRSWDYQPDKLLGKLTACIPMVWKYLICTNYLVLVMMGCVGQVAETIEV